MDTKIPYFLTFLFLKTKLFKNRKKLLTRFSGKEHQNRFGILHKLSHCGTIWMAKVAYCNQLALSWW